MLLASVFFVEREARKVLSISISSWATDPTADCGVVLTGGAGRLREGIALMQRNSIKTLIISGVHPQTELRDLIAPFDIAIGANPSQIILERRSQTTYGNAQQSMPLLEALQCKDFILITSSLHMYRAQRTFLANLPSSIQMLTHATPPSKVEESYFGLATEVLKSIFYSIWAYV